MEAGFVGRDASSRELHRRRSTTRSPATAASYLLAGEPGIGKSRLADELTRRAEERGARALVGRCWGGWWSSGVLALGPGAARVRRDTTRLRGRRGAPEITILRRRAAPSHPTVTGARAFGSSMRSATFLRRAHASPVVLVLDDLHAADTPSLLLLRFLARELRDAPADRRRLPRRDPRWEIRSPPTLPSSRASRTRGIALTGLTETEWPVASARAGGGRRPAWCRPSTRDRRQPAVRRSDRPPAGLRGAARRPDARADPRGRREVIGRRLGRLSDDCRDAAPRGAVLGREFELDALVRERAPAGELLDGSTRRWPRASSATSRERRAAFASHTAHPRHALRRPHRGAAAAAARRWRGARGAVCRDLEPHLAELAYHLPRPPAGLRREAAITPTGPAAAPSSSSHTRRRPASTTWRCAGRGRDAARCELMLALGEVQARARRTPGTRS